MQRDERALVVGPLAMPGFMLILIGVRRQRRVFVLAGALLLGLAIKLVDRPRGSADESEVGADKATTPVPAPEHSVDAEVESAQESSASTAPATPSKPPKPPKPRKPRAPAPPPAPAAESERIAPEAEPDQPESA